MDGEKEIEGERDGEREAVKSGVKTLRSTVLRKQYKIRQRKLTKQIKGTI